MYRSKQDVDKHVDNLLTKLSLKEFVTRAYSVARLYFEVGDYSSCQKYVLQYLDHKHKNAAAHKLLGQALQELGQKEKAFEHYKTALDIDPGQKSLILEICKLLADDEVFIDPERAKYWCEMAEAAFPQHHVTYHLREKLVSIENPNPEALTELIISELEANPKDTALHCRLLRHYLHNKKYKEAFDHTCNVEINEKPFSNNCLWYETAYEVLKHQTQDNNNWHYQLLRLTIQERLCMLSLTDVPGSASKSLVECKSLLYVYDQVLEDVSKSDIGSSFQEFRNALLHHHHGQYVFHSATFLLKKAKKDQLNWRDATAAAFPLMLVAWHTNPLRPNVNWLIKGPEKQQLIARRWYLEGSFRCSQSGHYLLANVLDKSHKFLSQISETCSVSNWRENIFKHIFNATDQLAKINSSYFVSKSFVQPILRLPRKTELEVFDLEAQKLYPNSLHHFIWILVNYKNYHSFKCTIFDMLMPKTKNYTNCGPETVNKLDALAFLFCAAMEAQQNNTKHSYAGQNQYIKLPANITDMQCSLAQMKWWDCLYKFSQNELGMELTDIRTTLSRGIEVVRCVDKHGLDPELLAKLGNYFAYCADNISSIEGKEYYEDRARLYYTNAIPLLEKLKNKNALKFPEKRMFSYTCQDLNNKDINNLIEECKLFIGLAYLKDYEFDEAINMLQNVHSAKASYYLSETYMKKALELNQTKDEIIPDVKLKYDLLSKAKNYGYKTIDKLKENQEYSKSKIFAETQELIENIESLLHRNGLDISYEKDESNNYSDNVSSGGSDHIHNPFPAKSRILSKSSTPKHRSLVNTTNYRSAMESQIFDNAQMDQKYFERIENQIKGIQKRDASINHFMEQTRNWIDDNRNLGNQITIMNLNIQNTLDQFKLLKLSVDKNTEEVVECRKDCKSVGELKKDICELKKEIDKLKKPSEYTGENGLYGVEDGYRSNESTSTFTPQIPFNTPQMVPPYNQRFVQPFSVPSYPLYSQNLYNLYNQYSQLSQPAAIPGAPPIFDPLRQMNYPSTYPTPDQIYTDMSQLIPPTATSIPNPTVSLPIPKIAQPNVPKKDIRQLPANVVITSSDPLPKHTSTPTPVLSVTVPAEHIRGTPHNHQIQMPVNESHVDPPHYSSNLVGQNVNNSSTTKPFSLWKPTDASNTTNITNNSSTNIPTFKSSLFDSKEGVSLCATPITKENVSSPNITLNKSRTFSEKSNTSVDNYDPCPDFKPIIPLPAEVKVTTGEESEVPIFTSRAKLYRFVDHQWKERGLGEMKLLKHNITGKVRVLMRREHVHKVCANHIITSEMDIQPMKNENKAYIWVANDYADEHVVLEKFCIRFKTAETAKQFYETFETARKNATVSSTKDDQRPMVNEVTASNDISQANKTVVGGFTFSNTPTFKIVKEENNKSSNKLSQAEALKPNPFSNLNLKSSVQSPFSNLFNDNTDSIQKNTNSKENTLDVVEEFEPTAEFAPVIPLPALINPQTGEEDEIILFEHRAKLLRFDVSKKEWKERGIGNIKLLLHKDNNKVRLLMRREQVMKVCCNHSITKDMHFEKMANLDKAVTWCAMDYSEGNLVRETLCLRFKTAEISNDFLKAVKASQETLKDKPIVKEDHKPIKQDHKPIKQNEVGFGDKFLPKAGSWYCEVCYTNNLDNFLNCACCNGPKPSNLNKIESQITTASQGSNWGEQFKPKLGTWECKQCLIWNDSNVDQCTACDYAKDTLKNQSSILKLSQPKCNFGVTAQASNDIKTDISSSWGDQFKPKLGTWECKQCFIRNDCNIHQCVACDYAKDPSLKGDSSSVLKLGQTKFNFGLNAQPSVDVKTVCTGWGDQFKAKMGTWECKQCLIQNEGNVNHCAACNNHKDSTNEKESISVLNNTSNQIKFSFGIPQNKTEPKFNVNSSSIFDGTGAHKFTFGMPSTDKFDTTPSSSFTFGSPNALNENKTAINAPMNFSTKHTEDVPKALSKPLLPLTPQKDITSGSQFSFKESRSFDFVFKPKSPMKDKNIKSPVAEKSDNEDISDDGQNIHFSPIIPLPDKVEVVTGEENEDELYANRALLYKLKSGEWVERGRGTVKVLKHKETGKYRVLMRRDQVHKICLNHTLIPEIQYRVKDEKSWIFVINDFSEGELELQSFCIRFSNKNIAQDFKNIIDKVQEGKLISSDKQKSDDDVIFVSEIQSTLEEKQTAKALMLPENFLMYKTKKPCQGCRGCFNDSIEDEESMHNEKSDNIFLTPVSSPSKSIYVTPVSTKTMPLCTSASITETGTLQSSGKVDKVLSKPKLNIVNEDTSKIDNKESKSIFTTVNNGGTGFNSIFGNVKTSLAFGGTNSILANNKSSTDVEEDKEKPEVRSIFGESDQKPFNLFSGTGTMFGMNSKVNEINAPNFGSGTVLNPNFVENPKSTISALGQSPLWNLSNNEIGATVKTDEDKKTKNDISESIFGNNTLGQKPLWSHSNNEIASTVNKDEDNKGKNNTSQSIFGINTQVQKPLWSFGNNSDNQIGGNTKSDVSCPTSTPVTFLTNIDSGLSFAALSAGPTKISVQSDFKWEGAGQQIFNSKGSKSVSSNNAGETENSPGQEYDPHYEPIIPLPDEITVTTGEEDEEIIFSEPCKLYRFNQNKHEWKERGIGNMKILYHPVKKTYRLLLRREKIHKAVLNTLLFIDFELAPMNKSASAWTWACKNYAEESEGEQELLAAKFSSIVLAQTFKERVVECVRKLQAAAAQEIREEKGTYTKISAHVDPLLSLQITDQSTSSPPKQESQPAIESDNKLELNGAAGVNKPHLHSQEDEDDYEDEYYDDKEYYHELGFKHSNYCYREDGINYFANDAHVIIHQETETSTYPNANVKVTYYEEAQPTTIITITNEAEVLAETIIVRDLDFQLDDESCSWMSMDETTGTEKTVTVSFPDSNLALNFYDLCETCKEEGDAEETN